MFSVSSAAISLIFPLHLLILKGVFHLLQVIAYIITVPAQRWEFPVLPWGKSSSITNKGSIYSLRQYCLTLLTSDLKATICSNKAITTKILQYHKPDTVFILVLQTHFSYFFKLTGLVSLCLFFKNSGMPSLIL